MHTINGHRTRISMDASSYDEICVKCGATDGIGTLGGLARPCPVPDKDERLSITCPKCGMTSHHPKDISERYCGRCHQFHEFL
jgi:ribosomal protein S27AE